MGDKSQRIVLVTGGAKGIGRGISERFLADGATVVACGREAPASLPAAGGRKVGSTPRAKTQGIFECRISATHS